MNQNADDPEDAKRDLSILMGKTNYYGIAWDIKIQRTKRSRTSVAVRFTEVGVR